MLAAVVAEAARRFGNKPALTTPAGWSMSYAQLDSTADLVAAGLARRGVAIGDVVALVLPSGCEYAVAYVALARLGAITVGVNPVLTAGECSVALEVVQPKLVIATERLAAGVPSDSVEVVDQADTPGSVLSALWHFQQSFDEPPDDLDRPVAIVLTSGTTGRPKGAVFTSRQLRAVTRYDLGGDAESSWGGGRAMLAGTQFAHVGFMTKFPWYLRTGSELMLLDRWRASSVLDIVERTRMPIIGGVAAQVALMLRDPGFDERDLSSVRALVVGGAPSTPALVLEARQRFGSEYSIRYSSTESGGVGTGTAFDAPDEEALHTVGRPRPGMGLQIRDEEDREVPAGEIGEVCLKSDAAMSGYWNDPETTAAALRNGWLHTGDLGFVDATGCLTLAGRVKEMFIRGGYNVYPMEVEAVLAEHPGIREVAVAPRQDHVMGEVGVALVVPTDPCSPPSLEELRSFTSGRLAAFKVPESLSIVSTLPLTSGQKLDRSALAEMVIEDNSAHK